MTRTTYAPAPLLRGGAGVAVAALLSALLIALWPTPSRAATTCTTVTHTTTAGILTTSDGEAVTATNPVSNGTATITVDGVVAAVPDALAKVQWLVAPSAPTKLADVNGLRLAMRNEVTGQFTASYQLVVNPEPNSTAVGAVHFTTLVWEAYKNGYGTVSGMKTYTLDPSGPEGWWSTKTLPAIPGAVAGDQKPFTLKTYVAAYPDATVTAYGWNIGKGSAGLKTTVGAIRFATTAGCVISRWALPVVASPSPSPSASTTPPPVYSGFAVRKQPLIEGRDWDHKHAGWIKPYHSVFLAELLADYDHVAPAGSPERAAQLKALFDRNASHRHADGSPSQPLIFLPATL